jgi:alanine racemase
MINEFSVLTINLSNLSSNYRVLREQVEPHTKVACVVKSDSYGLGAQEISKVLYKEGCREFYVDNLDEGINLRRVLDKNAKIFLFKGLLQGQEALIDHHNLIPVLNNETQIEIWQDYSETKGQNLPCCLHVDTGMTRLGIDLDIADKIIEKVLTKGILNIEYILSHLACADEKNHEMNDLQLKKFKHVSSKYKHLKYSLANSAGVFLSKELHFDQVRPGISLYGGLVGSIGQDKIKPVVSLTTKIINLYNIKTPATVGYSATYKTKKGQRMATISLGYFDGILRCLSNKGLCYIEGVAAPYVGNVSMGLVTIDITAVPEQYCNFGQEVEVIGSNISLETIAKLADTINHEILTSLRNIKHRVYI